MALAALLRQWGYEPTTVHDGAEALKVLDAGGPTLAILDWSMPRMTGLEVCRQIRRRQSPPYAYLIILTAREARQDVLDAFDAGADDFISKPYDPQVLRVRMQAAERILTLQGRLHRELQQRRDVEDQLRQARDQAHQVSQVLSDRAGQLEAARMISLNMIRDLEQKEQQLRKSEERFRALADSVPQTVFEMDADGRITYTNAAGFQTFGYTRAEMEAGLHALDMLCRRDRPRGRRNMQRILRGMASAREEYTAQRKDGRQFPVVVHTSAVYNDGQAVGLRGLVVDISPQKKAAEELRRSLEFQKQLLQAAATAIYTVDAQRRIVSVNDEFCRITGYSEKEVVGQECGVLHCPTCQEGCILDLPAGRQGKYRLQCTIHAKDGRLLTIMKNSIVLDGEGQNRASVIESFVDVTELVAAREELHELNRNLERKVEQRTSEVKQLLRQKDQFINQLGHDLKTPLTPLVALLPILSGEVQSDRGREILDVAVDNVSYMRNLMEKTLELARMNASTFELTLQRVDLLSETRNIIAGLRQPLDEAGIAVDNRITRPTTVLADPLRLREVFHNLIANAIKYTDGPGRISVDAKPVGMQVEVAFADTGIGMGPDQLANAFNEFYKADESRHDRASVGLGLAICRRIIDRHGGTISIDSDGPGQGTCVRFTLPAAGPVDASEPHSS